MKRTLVFLMAVAMSSTAMAQSYGERSASALERMADQQLINGIDRDRNRGIRDGMADLNMVQLQQMVMQLQNQNAQLQQQVIAARGMNKTNESAFLMLRKALESKDSVATGKILTELYQRYAKRGPDMTIEIKGR